MAVAKWSFWLKSGNWEHLGLCVLPCKVPYGYFKGYGSTLCVLSFRVLYVYFHAIFVCVLSWKYPMSPSMGGLYGYFVTMEVPYVDFHWSTLWVLSLHFSYVYFSSFSKKSAMLRHQTDCPTFCLRLTCPSVFEKGTSFFPMCTSMEVPYGYF